MSIIWSVSQNIIDTLAHEATAEKATEVWSLDLGLRVGIE